MAFFYMAHLCVVDHQLGEFLLPLSNHAYSKVNSSVLVSILNSFRDTVRDTILLPFSGSLVNT